MQIRFLKDSRYTLDGANILKANKDKIVDIPAHFASILINNKSAESFKSDENLKSTKSVKADKLKEKDIS